ncbi:MAG: OB-fold nucleic acid binding domain-containing protein [Candidatus Aenigmarchaeota archaeon]|nr:OB-fold nucleic acid binding domain-containing protein [Candidatus Aenigmarchaeota archaeon]
MAREVGDRWLATAALVLSIIGLGILLLYAQNLKPKHISISSVEAESEGAYLEVIGRVASSSSKGGSVFIRLCDRECIRVFVPGSQADILNLNPYLIKKGDQLSVRGTLVYYKGEPELVPLGSDGLELI